MFISIALITCKTSKKKHKLEVRKGILDGWMISESADAEMRRAQWVLPACKHLVLSTYHIWPNSHTLSSKQGHFPCLIEDTPNIDLTMYILRIQSKTWIWAQVSRNNTAKSHLSINLLKYQMQRIRGERCLPVSDGAEEKMLSHKCDLQVNNPSDER